MVRGDSALPYTLRGTKSPIGAFPSAVGCTLFALFLSVGFRLPELFALPGLPSFLRIISVMHHVFASLTLMFMVLASIPDQRAARENEQEAANGEDSD